MRGIKNMQILTYKIHRSQKKGIQDKEKMQIFETPGNKEKFNLLWIPCFTNNRPYKS